MRLAAGLRHWLIKSGDGFLLPLVILAFFWQLGRPALFDLDEGAFSAATWEMLQRGDYITTFLNGQPRFDKPILIYWLQAMSVSLFGLQEWALRLPSALAASSWVIATYYFAKAYLPQRSAQLAAVMVASSAMIVLIGRAATADALLNLLITLSLFDIWRYWQQPSKALLWRVFVWLGLGFLTKGPVAVAIPLVVSAFLYISQGQWRPWLQTVFNPQGLGIFLLIVLPWYLLEYAAQGQAFIDGFFFKHNLNRFADTMEGHGGSVWYYLIALPFIIMPFGGLLVQLLWPQRFRAANTSAPVLAKTFKRFLWFWFLAVLAFFSFSNTQLPHYVLYGITPLLILLAHACGEQPNRWLAVIPALLVALLLLALPELLQLAAGSNPDPYWQGLLAQASKTTGFTYRLAAVLYVMALALLLWWPKLANFWRLIGVALMQTLFFGSILIPVIAYIQQSPVKEAARFARHQLPEATIVMDGVDMPSFTVYRQTVTPKRAPQVGDYVFSQIGAMQPAEYYEVVFQQGGIMLARRLQ